MNKREVVDNFLTPEQHQTIYDALVGEHFPWHYVDSVSGWGESYPFSYYFAHIFYSRCMPRSSYLELFEPIFLILKPNAIVNIKANFYPHTSEKIKHGFHTDVQHDVKSLLYFVNDNNGVTTFQDTGEEIQSVANRGLFFNSNDLHCSSTCSDAKFRITINFNYF